jgi:hypothetical protein
LRYKRFSIVGRVDPALGGQSLVGWAGLQVPELGDVQLQRGLAAEAQRLWLQQAFDNSSGLVSGLQREVAATLTALGEMHCVKEDLYSGQMSLLFVNIRHDYLCRPRCQSRALPAHLAGYLNVAAYPEACISPMLHALRSDAS